MLDLHKVSVIEKTKTLLSAIDLCIHANQCHVIVGPSGAGKSTLLKVMSRLQYCTSGMIYLDGQGINPMIKGSKSALQDYHSQVGMVFQSFHLWPHLSVLKNLTLAPTHVLKIKQDAATQQAIDWLNELGIGDKAKAYPSELSGGQQQKVAIARALMMKPKILLFDEPTSALDPHSTQSVKAIIQTLMKKNITPVVTTHDLNFAQSIANQVTYLEDGAIIETGPSSLFRNPSTDSFKSFIHAHAA